MDPSRTLAQLVLEQPSRTRALERLGLDYCCGGKRSLTDACAARGIDLDEALAALAADAEPGGEEDEDWTDEPLAALCEHIVEVHHGRLRAELPRLSELLAKVERAHGRDRPELAPLRTTFEAMRAELEVHMLDEEARLFPACTAGEPLAPGLLAELEAEHLATASALERLRELTGGFDLTTVRCNTHRATVDGLRELELDLHRHIHEENNVLFPRALAAV